MVRNARWIHGMACLGAFALAGCQSNMVTARGMTVQSADLKAPAVDELASSMAIEEVSGGGSGTNAAGLPDVSNDDLKTALINSLQAAGLFAPGGTARFKLRAKLLSFLGEKSAGAFDTTIAATIQYTVTDARSGAVVFHEALQVPFTARQNDSAIEITRIRIAVEGSARKNIATFIDKVNATKLQAQKEGEAPKEP